MKKVFFFLAMALVSVFATAQTSSNYNQVVWLNGKMMYANPIPAIDSITYTDDATAQDTLHLILPRTIEYIKYDTITVVLHDTVWTGNCGEGGDESSKGIGTFYVSTDKQVSFSKGNLQYQAGTTTWRFAENQYDYVGDANSNISATYEGWVDLFGWSANNTTAPFGVSTSTTNADYSGDFVDWGTNKIGNDAANTWRTLTSDEWKYLFTHTRWTLAKVNGTLGFVFLPDGIEVDGMSLIGDGKSSDLEIFPQASQYSSNIYTAEQFAQMETKGCVFLPCAGKRSGAKVTDVEYGDYWSATPATATNARYWFFMPNYIGAADDTGRNNGISVRLVQDIK